jgi:DNA-binding NarL/FixJ family response regulator
VTAFPRTVLVVEDDALLRELLASALSQRGFTVDTAASASEAREVFHATDPDGMLLDVDLGSGPNGFDLADTLLADAPGVGVVFLTALPDPRFVGRSRDELPPGIAYLRKSAVHDIDRLVATLDAAMKGSVDASMRHDRDDRRPFAELTRRQIEVLGHVAMGRTNAQIAAIRGTTVKAVEETVTRAFAALGVQAETDGNVRVAAVRRLLETIGPRPTPHHHATGHP